MSLHELANLLSLNEGESLAMALNAFAQKTPLTPEDIKILRKEVADPATKSILEQWIETSAIIKVPRKENEKTSSEVLEKNLYFSISNAETANKALKLFYKAFIKNVKDANFEYSIKICRLIVDALLRNFKFDNSIVFSKYSALNDSNNSLANKIYEGKVSPARFANMNSDEMKSEILLKQEKKYHEKGIFDSSVPTTEAETDMFFCMKCKQNRTSYRQLQTRSADEPMTTYVFCVCGNTWKF